MPKRKTAVKRKPKDVVYYRLLAPVKRHVWNSTTGMYETCRVRQVYYLKPRHLTVEGREIMSRRGGFVSSAKNLPQSPHGVLDPCCFILDDAVVTGNVRVREGSTIRGAITINADVAVPLEIRRSVIHAAGTIAARGDIHDCVIRGVANISGAWRMHRTKFDGNVRCVRYGQLTDVCAHTYRSLDQLCLECVTAAQTTLAGVCEIRGDLREQAVLTRVNATHLTLLGGLDLRDVCDLPKLRLTLRTPYTMISHSWGQRSVLLLATGRVFCGCKRYSYQELVRLYARQEKSEHVLPDLLWFFNAVTAPCSVLPSVTVRQKAVQQVLEAMSVMLGQARVFLQRQGSAKMRQIAAAM